MQRDSNTYCEEPSDPADFAAFKENYSLDGSAAEISALLESNPFMSELQMRIVPLVVDRETFWTMYFYRLSKLIQVLWHI